MVGQALPPANGLHCVSSITDRMPPNGHRKGFFFPSKSMKEPFANDEAPQYQWVGWGTEIRAAIFAQMSRAAPATVWSRLAPGYSTLSDHTIFPV